MKPKPRYFFPGKLLGRLWPLGLASRFILMLSLVILTSQALTSAVWYNYSYLQEKEGLETALESIASNAAFTVSYYRKLPKSSRHLILEQNRSMGGTRFFISLNSKRIDIDGLPESSRKQELETVVNDVLQRSLGAQAIIDINFGLRNDLRVYDAEVPLDDIPHAFARYTIEKVKGDPPVLVMQFRLPATVKEASQSAPLEQWLYLATNLPSPYISLESRFLDSRQINFILLTSVLVLLCTWLIVRREIKPIKNLARAAKLMGSKMDAPIIKEEGSGELIAAVHAFNTMNRRIRAYIRDRDLLFGAISHDLKTPIACLKLRTEMLDDDETKMRFERSLNELEFMVKGALNYIKDTDIREQVEWVDINAVLAEISAFYGADSHYVDVAGGATRPFLCKPVAIKRMLHNLIENGVKYGKHVDISILDTPRKLIIKIRDHGPGIPDELRERVFEPYFRIKQEKEDGTGLGLSIVRNIVRGHAGKLVLQNHEEGGLLVTLSLPREE
ncbi:ATP-binding protein [Enterovibrio sp. ZSDZ35]|uniref:histidine kinase n=1 Tax=Enterovibrio qingdaonensis TaxID=2899818 RepID=A0ABT5QQ68_9GAMM|nr:ATP-binding protein [Enterovibrio sp. ZSDZ35]MDD1783129.1 ATP-binding protein [Enterovibrio sp. ZSDZ35]